MCLTSNGGREAVMSSNSADAPEPAYLVFPEPKLFTRAALPSAISGQADGGIIFLVSARHSSYDLSARFGAGERRRRLLHFRDFLFPDRACGYVLGCERAIFLEVQACEDIRDPSPAQCDQVDTTVIVQISDILFNPFIIDYLLWHVTCDDLFGSMMFGRRASQLLRELDCSEAGQLGAFNSDIFEHVIKECNEHNLQLQSLIRKIEDANLDIQTTRNEDHFGAVIHHLSLARNKRCLMSYMYNRAKVIRSLRWKIGPVLPLEIQEKLNYSEEEYYKNHSTVVESYMSELDLDLTVDMVPPKDPYIRVKVLDDIGEVCLGDHTIPLTQQSLHFIKRTDAEPFISQGLMEEFLE